MSECPTLVVLVEDHRATRECVLELLRHAPGIICVGSYSSAEEVERKLPDSPPHVVLMDINLPGKNGIECVQTLKCHWPKTEFLMLTTYDSSSVIFDALRAGASGYILKRMIPDELLTAITEVQAGGAPMSMGIARKVMLHFREKGEVASDLGKLTKREQEILGLLAKGLSYKQIAAQVFISSGTVHRHLHAIYRKLHVESRTEAVLKFLGK